MYTNGKRSLAQWSFVLVALFSTVGPAMAADSIAWRRDFESALREAQAQHKPVLMMTTAVWCHYCHKMIDETYGAAEVARVVNATFIPVLVDADRQPAIVRWAEVRGFPTSIVVAPDRRILKRITGYQPAAKFLESIAEFRSKPKPAESSTEVASFSSPAAVANDGYCPVAMLEEQRLVRGSIEFSTEYDGRTYLFETDGNRRAFGASPQRYLPVAGGRCVVRGDGTPGTVRWASVYRDRLWYFSDRESRDKFNASPADYRE